jgi:hypothetical protein
MPVIITLIIKNILLKIPPLTVKLKYPDMLNNIADKVINNILYFIKNIIKLPEPSPEIENIKGKTQHGRDKNPKIIAMYVYF